jgi:CO/xanthine dehydrogenase Mo-binding subunit
VVNALADALGGADVQIPVTPEQIWRALRNR